MPTQKEKSKKDTILFVHGAFCGGWVFDDFKSLFEANGYQCLTPDLPYHDQQYRGRPATKLGNTSLTEYADFLEDYIKELGEPPILVGHSMGGLLCQMLAARGLVKSVILLAPCAPWGILPTTFYEYANAMGIAMMSPALLGRPLMPNFAVAIDQSLHQLSKEKQREIYKHFVPESGRATYEIFHWGFDIHSASYVAARDVKCPVLTIAARKDRINPPSTVKQIHRRYKNKQNEFHYAKESSHWIVSEDGWEILAQHGVDWLANLED
jgi:non-heme chloroperoxidase